MKLYKIQKSLGEFYCISEIGCPFHKWKCRCHLIFFAHFQQREERRGRERIWMWGLPRPKSNKCDNKESFSRISSADLGCQQSSPGDHRSRWEALEGARSSPGATRSHRMIIEGDGKYQPFRDKGCRQDPSLLTKSLNEAATERMPYATSPHHEVAWQTRSRVQEQRSMGNGMEVGGWSRRGVGEGGRERGKGWLRTSWRWPAASRSSPEEYRRNSRVFGFSCQLFFFRKVMEWDAMKNRAPHTLPGIHLGIWSLSFRDGQLRGNRIEVSDLREQAWTEHGSLRSTNIGFPAIIAGWSYRILPSASCFRNGCGKCTRRGADG